jgi:hypothetical protein
VRLVRRAIACLLAGGLLLAAGCSDDSDGTTTAAPAGPPPTAKVVDCGLTNPQHGEAQAYAQVTVTNTGTNAGRVRVVVSFLVGGDAIGQGEASSETLQGGGTAMLSAVGADGATKVDTCKVTEVERI